MKPRQLNLFADKQDTTKTCVWATASTNPRTLKSEMPLDCRKKNCKGVFQNETPLCFVPDMRPEDRRDYEQYQKIYDRYAGLIQPEIINYYTCIYVGNMAKVEEVLEQIAVGARWVKK